MKRQLLFVAFAAAITPAFAVNLVTNGSFESEPNSVVTQTYGLLGTDAPPTGWSFTASDFNSFSYTESNSDASRPIDPGNNATINAQDGDWYLSMGAFDASGGTPQKLADYDQLSQTLATTSGTTYNLSYYVWTTGGDYFNASWNGAAINGTTIANGTDSSAWVLYTATVTGTGSDVLSLNGFNNATTVEVDNVSLTAQAVPEPMSLIGLGLGAVALLRRRRSA